MKRAFVFPGQGAQAVGMGKALVEKYPQSREVFDEVDNALGRDLSKIIWTGTIEELTLTTNAQPALAGHLKSRFLKRLTPSMAVNSGLLS